MALWMFRFFLLSLLSPSSASALRPSRDLRIVDAAGQLASVGLLQVSTRSGYGSVCGLNEKAAEVVCRMMGHDFGTVALGPCANYGGVDLCGAAGSQVALKDLRCNDDAIDLNGCVWSPADSGCADHHLDSIVFCGNDSPNDKSGMIRLMTSDGAPTIDGRGRLEMQQHGKWVTVCSAGFTQGAAVVACKEMGFSGVLSPSMSSTCAAENLCTSIPEVSGFACSGDEAALSACPHDAGDEVFCAAKEAVLVFCAGDGDSSGR
eukprot:TRINITY_DN1052_c0_g1_i6.p1 TRINITY_DN1052_c0_g1~~TRINITY_DN1052_c0_g1_i6.p1  ORF type:complete len:262 (+),score=39.27 TRINITY_DN1052_c0_g1_i6:62-847(+)